jgi:hypothetical protein
VGWWGRGWEYQKCEEDEGTECEGDSDLIGKSVYNLTCFVYIAYAINSKIFFLADISFVAGRLDFDIYIFSWLVLF